MPSWKETAPEQAYLEELDPAPVEEGMGPGFGRRLGLTQHSRNDDLISDLMGEHKRTAIRAGLDILIALDYLAMRRNPIFGYDHVCQYALHYTPFSATSTTSNFAKNRVSSAKNRAPKLKYRVSSAKNRAPKREKSRSQTRKYRVYEARKIALAIPESTTEQTETESTIESTTEQAPAPAQSPSPSQASSAAGTVAADDGNPELAKCLLKFGITKNAKTAPIFASDTLTPADVERVFGEAEQKGKGGTVKSVSGLAIHLLLNYQPAPRTLNEHPLKYGYNGQKGETLICDRCGAEYQIESNRYHRAAELVCDCGGFLDIDRTAELETAA